MKAACPCGRPLDYAGCCGRLHAGAEAADAESLMRSRYSAYVHELGNYLLRTWHPDTRPAGIEFDSLRRRRWLGLEVRQHLALDDDHASVEFVARSRVGGGPAQRLHERSRFVRVQGRWLYLDGETPG